MTTDRIPEPAWSEIARVLELDPNGPTGLRWKDRAAISGWKKHKLGLPAGTKTKKGYWRVQINGKNWMNHRLVWILHHQLQIPIGMEVDHRDGDPGNNRVSNLRLAKPTQNMANRKSVWSATGHRNIHRTDSNVSPWRARVWGRDEITGKSVCQSKCFALLSDALAFRDRIAGEIHGEFAATATSGIES